MLTKISRGIRLHRVQIRLHRVQTVSATVLPINPRKGPDLRITLMKYGRHYLRIVGVDAKRTLFDISLRKI